jgi:fimbrial chaperone protein
MRQPTFVAGLGLRGLVLALALLCGAPLAGASSLQVRPTMLMVPANQHAAGLTLSNLGTEPFQAQVRVFVWRQANGEDILEATDDVVVSPPMLRIEPGREQLVRVVRQRTPPLDQEASYRLLVDEIPGARPVPENTAGLRFVLRYSIPVFLSPPVQRYARPVLHTRLTTEGDQHTLVLENTGTAHAQVAELVYTDPQRGTQVIGAGLAGYLLPGQTRRWRLPATLSLGDEGAFKARINGELTPRTLAPVSVLR